MAKCVVPALFVLFIAPLAQAIREDPEIKGISIGENEYKSADDILLTLTDLQSSAPKLMSLLRLFGSYSRYRLNTHKTQILSYNFTPNTDLRGTFDFKWDAPAIKYLGVWIPKDISKIYEMNFG